MLNSEKMSEYMSGEQITKRSLKEQEDAMIESLLAQCQTVQPENCYFVPIHSWSQYDKGDNLLEVKLSSGACLYFDGIFDIDIDGRQYVKKFDKNHLRYICPEQTRERPGAGSYMEMGYDGMIYATVGEKVGDTPTNISFDINQFPQQVEGVQSLVEALDKIMDSTELSAEAKELAKNRFHQIWETSGLKDIQTYTPEELKIMELERKTKELEEKLALLEEENKRLQETTQEKVEAPTTPIQEEETTQEEPKEKPEGKVTRATLKSLLQKRKERNADIRPQQ